jgi:hypothetical protein
MNQSILRHSTALLLLFFLGLSGTLFAQKANGTEINPGDPAFRAKYDKVDFKGKLAVKILSDETNNYYMVDFSRMKTRFEKVLFLNLSYQDKSIVNMEGDLSHDRIWYLSAKQNKGKDVLKKFDGIYAKMKEQEKTMSEKQQFEYLRKADKFK